MNERRPLVGGNWKMHKTAEEARRFCQELVTGLQGSSVAANPRDSATASTGEGGAHATPATEVVIFPSHPLLAPVAEALRGAAVALGGQDLHPADEGAHTGDVSGAQLVDAGCAWTLCGHSERRRDHAESDALVAEKAIAARRHGLVPLVCVGELLEQRQAGETFAVLERQLSALLDAAPDRFELAYEPVWAIGTGETATPEQAQEAHAFLRRTLESRLGAAAAEQVRILYGGSVKPDNAAELAAGADVDGFLVGGASLDAASFLAIIGACGLRPSARARTP